MGLLFLVLFIGVAVVSYSGDQNINTSPETDSDIPKTIRRFSEFQKEGEATTATHLTGEPDYTTSTVNKQTSTKSQFTFLSDLLETSNSTQFHKSAKSTETPTKPSTVILSRDQAFKQVFLQLYRINRQRYECPVSVCDPGTFNTLLSDYTPSGTSCCYTGCSCDDLCERRGDCCPDRIQNLLEPRRYPGGGLTSCKQNSLKELPGFDEIFSGFFVSKCDVTFTDNVTIRACEQASMDFLESIVPVSDKITQEAYTNKYCAICNYVKEENILYWDPKLMCNDSSFIHVPRSLTTVIADVLAEPKCNILYIPPAPGKTYHPTYCRQAISTCNISGNWNMYDPIIEAGCAAFYSPIPMTKETYRNIFCFLCNHQYGEDSPSCIHKKDEVYPFPSFAAILDFRSMQVNSPVLVKNTESHKCTSGLVYDHYQEKCLNIVCPMLTEQKGETCEKILQSVVGICLEAYIKVDLPEPVYDETFDKSVYYTIKDRLRTCDWANMHIFMYYQPVFGNSSVQNWKMTREYYVLYITTDDFECVDELLSLDRRDIVLSQRNGKRSINATVHVYDVLSEITENTDTMKGLFLDDILMLILSIGASHPCHRTSKPIMVTKFLVCPAVGLKISDASIFLRNGSIHIAEIGLTLSKYDFTVDEDGVLLCIDDYIPTTRSFITEPRQETQATVIEQSNIIGFITLVCVCCSIISLCITLALYLLLPPLRTQPGINNIFMSLSLLLALATFQFGAGRIGNYLICTIIAVTVHFLWLNNIFWMNICCYHMFRTFSQLTLHKLNDASKTTTLKYGLYCISLSSLFVVVNVVYSLSTNMSGKIGYGKRANMCYIQSHSMVAFTMTLPAFMVVLSNFVMYTKVICTIQRNRFESSSSRKHDRNFIIYVKLSSLTGLAWMSYIPVYFTNSIVFEIIFSALVTCQGVFIMIAFVCNKRVFKALKDRMSGRLSASSSSRYTNSSKDTVVSTITSE